MRQCFIKICLMNLTQLVQTMPIIYRSRSSNYEHFTSPQLKRVSSWLLDKKKLYCGVEGEILSLYRK